MRSDPRKLSDLVSVGPAMLRDFEILGVRSVSQLARRNPERMYESLCRDAPQHQDICCLDVFCAAVAQANSLDSRTAANGGTLGCTYTEAQVEQALQVQSVTAGQPIAPVQDSTTGQWIIYEVTSQAVAPLSAASPLARRELLQSTANVNRVSREIVAFARTSDVSVDPQYGTWDRLTVVPPVAPPSRYLLGAVSGQAPLVARATAG